MLYSLYCVSLYKHSTDILSLYKSLSNPNLRHKLCTICLLLVSSLTAYLLCYTIRFSLVCFHPIFPCIIANLHYYSSSYLSLTERTIHSLTEFPLGLKLHPVLANFLSSFCIHHINLWRDIVSYFIPFITDLVLYTQASLFLYLNSQLTLCILLDLLRLLTLPIPVLLLYTHKTTLIILQVLKHLGLLFIGKNWDPIMRRVSSVPLTPDQLMISTIIFLSILFLYPTLLTLYFSVLALSLPLYLVLLTGDSVVGLISEWNILCLKTADKKPGTTLHYLQLRDAVGPEEWKQIGDWVIECRYILTQTN